MSLPLAGPRREREHLAHAARAGALLCAIHCALTPVVVSLMPAAGLHWLEHPLLEFGLLGITVSLLAPRLAAGWSATRDLRPIGFAATGVLLLLAGVAATSTLIEIFAGVGGALLLLRASLYRIPGAAIGAVPVMEAVPPCSKPKT